MHVLLRVRDITSTIIRSSAGAQPTHFGKRKPPEMLRKLVLQASKSRGTRSQVKIKHPANF